MVRKSGYRLPDADIDLAIILILGVLKRIYVPEQARTRVP